MSCIQNEIFYEYCDEQGIDPEGLGDSEDLDSVPSHDSFYEYHDETLEGE